ncbi:MAG: hypothetical protein WC829_03845 [Hyphomicrobium sp.]
MNRTLKFGICALAGVMTLGAVIGSASAAYLGYDNGDPGNWSYNTEQAGGPCNLPGQRSMDRTTGQAKCCAQYNPMSACPLAHAPALFDRHVERRAAGAY